MGLRGDFLLKIFEALQGRCTAIAGWSAIVAEVIFSLVLGETNLPLGVRVSTAMGKCRAQGYKPFDLSATCN